MAVMFRMMAEYSEPMARFRRQRIEDTVVFFGSARFRALDEANEALELLENTGSAKAAPPAEQPARPDEVESGEASDVKLMLAESAVEMARYYEDARKLAAMLTTWSKSLPGRQASLRRHQRRRSQASWKPPTVAHGRLAVRASA